MRNDPSWLGVLGTPNLFISLFFSRWNFENVSEKRHEHVRRALVKIPSCFILGENLYFLNEERSRHLDARVEVRTVSDVNFVACGVKHIGCTFPNPQLSSL